MKKVILGTMILGSLSFIGCMEKTEIVEFEATNSMKVSDEKITKPKFYKDKMYHEFLHNELIRFEGDKLITGYLVVDKEIESDDLIPRDRISLEGKTYNIIHPVTADIDDDGNILVKGKKKYKITGLEVEVLENGDKVYRENIKFKEFKKLYLEDGLYLSEEDKGNMLGNIFIGEKELKDIIYKVNEKYEENFVRNNNYRLPRVKGSERFLEDSLFLGGREGNAAKIIYDYKENKYYSMYLKSNENMDIFEHKEKLYGINNEGNLLELKLEKSNIEIKKEYEKGIDFVEGDEKGVSRLIYKDEEYAYIINESKLKSTIESKNKRKVLYSYNLENKKISVIGDTDFSDNSFIRNYYINNGYLVFTNGTGQKIGKLAGDKIKIIIDEVLIQENARVYFGDEGLIIEHMDKVVYKY
ncbi:MAG: hypothetical protein ACRCWM_06295 [Sarcina sp.]